MASKCYLMRHGETEWSKNGKHTGKTDLPLTHDGEERVKLSAQRIVGENTLIEPSKITQIFVSPRKRAKRTLELLSLPSTIPVEETELIAEWDYGDYEGLTSKEINARTGTTWNVFRDGCPNGDTQDTVTKRIDELITKIRKIHADADAKSNRADVMVVAHGHILRSFAARWIKDPVLTGTRLAYDAGGAGVLGYEHGSLEEPTIECWNVTDKTLK